MSFYVGFADELLKVAQAGHENRLDAEGLYDDSSKSGRDDDLQEFFRPAAIRPAKTNLKKQAGVKETARQLASIARHDPAKLKDIAKKVLSGPGGSVARGVTYGAAGYSALKGLGYRDPETRKREPFEGALKGALKGGSIGALAALAFRYPALRKAVARHAEAIRR